MSRHYKTTKIRIIQVCLVILKDYSVTSGTSLWLSGLEITCWTNWYWLYLFCAKVNLLQVEYVSEEYIKVLGNDLHLIQVSDLSQGLGTRQQGWYIYTKQFSDILVSLATPEMAINNHNKGIYVALKIISGTYKTIYHSQMNGIQLV